MKDNKELLRTIKFVLFSCSAGIIELGVNSILSIDKLNIAPWLSYLIALVASVLWNFTFNRKFTFKSASNVPKAMGLTFLFYLFFAPATIFLTGYLTDGNIFGVLNVEHLGLHEVVSTIICMVLNFVLEYLYQRFIVFKDSLDTNDLAKKEELKEE